MNEVGLALEPGNILLQRTLADGLVASAYTRTLASRALAIEEPLATADPLNAEAPQDLAYAHYTLGRVLPLRGESPAAAAGYRESLCLLGPLLAASPGNVETAFDLERSRRSLLETEGR